MADEFQLGSGNWWDSSRTRFESGSSPSSSAITTAGSYGWPPEARSSMESASASGRSVVFQEAQKLQGPDSGVLGDPNLQFVGLGLSSQAMDWNQTLLRGGKSETSFDLSSNTNFQQETDYKPISRGFSLDQQQFSSHISPSESVVTSQGLASSFQMDPAAYGGSSTSFQGLLATDHSHQPPINYQYLPSYGVNSGEVLPSWSNKFPQFLRNSPPKQPAHGHLQFSNSTPFWNATASAMEEVRSSFLPSPQPQFPPSTFEEKPKSAPEARDLTSGTKKSSSEASSKRPRNETQSPLPAFKVRKEKMGDRITALQQLVSPFGKTDTASVLSEAIEYIKFLHEQVNVLSTPYMKSGGSMQQHQSSSDKSKETDGPKQDLRSRGLCLVPVSSTFPMTHETTADFWTPTFGGTFR
ncbi:hypothetical protein NMG60_11037173 [Bertholletia excelsa]